VILHTGRGVAFQVDDDDVFAVERYPWALCGRTGYVKTDLSKHSRTRTKITLHAFLGGSAPNGMYWDHINRDRLDNRRQNLRLVTPQQSARNSCVRSTNTSGVKGVWFCKQTGLWAAEILVSYKKIWLGRHATFESAVSARKSAEERLW